MSGISNVSTQETQQVNFSSGSTGGTQEVQNGKLDNLVFVVQNGEDVDPTTKDDEVASGIKSEKETQKANNNKSKEEQKKKINAALKKEAAQDVNEQQQQGKRISKNTERILNSISQFTKKDSEGSIKERSNKLFSGSEGKYEKFFNTLNQCDVLKSDEKGGTWEVKALDKASILATLRNQSGLKDVAEQHNALQIVADTWERKLTKLQELKRDKFPNRNNSKEEQSEYKNLENQINQFEKNLDEVKAAQGDLLARNKDRIESSYVLAPLLREVTANMTGNVEVAPKNLHDLVLDEILPLGGDDKKLFQCLNQNLTKLFSANGNERAGYNNFLDNIDRALMSLRDHTNAIPSNTLPSSVLGAIINTSRTIEKLANMHSLNTNLVTLVANMQEKGVVNR